MHAILSLVLVEVLGGEAELDVVGVGGGLAVHGLVVDPGEADHGLVDALEGDEAGGGLGALLLGEDDKVLDAVVLLDLVADEVLDVVLVGVDGGVEKVDGGAGLLRAVAGGLFGVGEAVEF